MTRRIQPALSRRSSDLRVSLPCLCQSRQCNSLVAMMTGKTRRRKMKIRVPRLFHSPPRSQLCSALVCSILRRPAVLAPRGSHLLFLHLPAQRRPLVPQLHPHSAHGTLPFQQRAAPKSTAAVLAHGKTHRWHLKVTDKRIWLLHEPLVIHVVVFVISVHVLHSNYVCGAPYSIIYNCLICRATF